MKRILTGLAILFGFLTAAAAQVVPFPQSLPANTVVGRTGISAGPAQAIPFSILTTNLLISLCQTSGAVPVFNATTGLWQCSTASNSNVVINGPASGLNTLLSTTQTVTGTLALPSFFTANNIQVNDNSNAFVFGININQSLNAASWKGPKTALSSNIFLNVAPTTASGSVNDYNLVAFGPAVQGAVAVDPAKNVTLFAENPVVLLLANATGYNAILGAEYDISIATGASAVSRIGIQVISTGPVAASGAADAAYVVGTNTSMAPWKAGFYWFPNAFNSSSTIIGSAQTTNANVGVDFNTVTFTTAAFRSAGFVVDPAGKETLTVSKTSGVIALAVNATQTQSNSSDTGDSAVNISYTITANSATNELVPRGLNYVMTNTLTGGGAIQSARLIDVAYATSASTTTTEYNLIYMENGATAGTVTTGYGLRIAGLQGTAKWGIADDSGANWYNATGGLSLGSTTAAGNGILLTSSYVRTGSTTVGSLPTCNAGAKAARHFVTDANATFTAGIGAVVAAGGANNVPVTCDGTNWRIG